MCDDYLSADRLPLAEVEEEFLDPEKPSFSRHVPLTHMVEVLDELWEGERTL